MGRDFQCTTSYTPGSILVRYYTKLSSDTRDRGSISDYSVKYLRKYNPSKSPRQGLYTSAFDEYVDIKQLAEHWATASCPITCSLERISFSVDDNIQVTATAISVAYSS